MVIMKNRLIKRKIGRWIVAVFLSITSCVSSFASSSVDPYAGETKEQRDERMAWWREARFGMFIHWGVYAVPAGTYNGEQIKGIGEWIMLRGKIPVAEYKAYAKEFNPVNYDPVAWAQLAKAAGMRYVVITSKHHDGFALFPSAVSDWDIADASPYGKDLIGPLADAARAEGLKFGLYYSQAQDWTHPGGSFWPNREKEGEGHWDEGQKGDFDSYLDAIAVPQVDEILSRYQPDILWWDTPAWMDNTRAERLLPLLETVPDIIHNNRLGGDYKGDTETPEQHIPATGFKDRDWEVCMTMNDTWGYKSYDQNWKSTKDLIQKLCDIVSKGGNFLLNVGPTAKGEIPLPSIERLQAVGRWMDVNGESIYGTTASPFYRLHWGRCTKKLHGDGATLYLHVFDWPEDGRLLVPGLKNLPVNAILLHSGEALKADSATDGEKSGVVLTLPKTAPDPYSSVIKLEVEGKLEVDSLIPSQDQDGAVKLMPVDADLHNRPYGVHVKLQTAGGSTTIGNWTDAQAWVGWMFEVKQPGTFRVEAELASSQPSRLQWGLAGESMNKVFIEPTEGASHFETRTIGEVTVNEPGIYQLEFKPVNKSWKPISVRNLVLHPAH
ncbi:hypothetical protein PDESU_03718 [Pontiella desulfatans]|uniref:alpha-L-fucosidase n=2 Tax=Pontiella desulfatans TaxID=2750659 RepID=A0A6C2U5Q1_PONDE|nr:hypothetical protein PDESU_03718 [Pontiella desulfatans]